MAQLTPTFELCAKVGVGRSFSGGQCGRGARKAADERLLAIVCLDARLFLIVLERFVSKQSNKPVGARRQEGTRAWRLESRVLLNDALEELAGGAARRTANT